MLQKEKRKLFKKLCYLSYDQRKEILDKNPQYKNWFLFKSPSCKHCKKEIDPENFTIGTSYWGNFMETYCSEKCRLEREKINAKRCQKVDANCNDCKFFERDGWDNNAVVKREIFPAVGGYKGVCKKFNKKVVARNNFCTNYKCFIHRDYAKI